MTEPSLRLTSFTCPNCRELSEQAWFNAYANRISNAAGVPLRIAGADLERLSQNQQFPPEVRRQKVEYWNKVIGGEVFLDRWTPVYSDLFIAGLELSVCHACLQTAVWLGGEMVFPCPVTDQ